MVCLLTTPVKTWPYHGAGLGNKSTLALQWKEVDCSRNIVARFAQRCSTNFEVQGDADTITLMRMLLWSRNG